MRATVLAIQASSSQKRHFVAFLTGDAHPISQSVLRDGSHPAVGVHRSRPELNTRNGTHLDTRPSQLAWMGHANIHNLIDGRAIETSLEPPLSDTGCGRTRLRQNCKSISICPLVNDAVTIDMVWSSDIPFKDYLSCISHYSTHAYPVFRL